MKMLNNKGWGLNTLITFIVIFLVFILVIAILAYNIGIETDSKNSIYEVSDNDK